MGYAEEYDVSRYFVDARVLSIFEGADETLALEVVARRLLEASRRRPRLRGSTSAPAETFLPGQHGVGITDGVHDRAATAEQQRPAPIRADGPFPTGRSAL